MKVMVRYPHRSDDLDTIYLAVGLPGPGGRQWQPAYRDTFRGERIIWVRSDRNPATVWVKDSRGQRQVSTDDIL